MDLLHRELTFGIIGAAMEVHRSLGPGFLESVYQRGMECELRHRGLLFESQVRIGISYKGAAIGEHVLDLIVNRTIIIELKAAREMNEHHQAQLISYLKAARLPLGLLINFAKASLDYKRILLKDSLRS